MKGKIYSKFLIFSHLNCLNDILTQMVLTMNFNGFSHAEFYQYFMTSIQAYVRVIYGQFGFSTDESFISSVTLEQIMSTSLFGSGQASFVKFFFKYVQNVYLVSADISWDSSDASRYDLGVILNFASGFDYVTAQFTENFEHHLAYYTYTFKSSLHSLSILYTPSVVIVTRFMHMSFSMYYEMMTVLCKFDRFIYSSGFDLRSMSQVYSIDFYGTYTRVGAGELYSLEVSSNADFTATFSAIYSISDWSTVFTTIMDVHILYPSFIIRRVYCYIIWFMEITVRLPKRK